MALPFLEGATTLQMLALAGWLAVGVVHLAVMLLTLLHPVVMRRRAARRGDQPPVSVLLPVKAVDHDVPDCFGRLARQEYPEIEILVCSDSEDAPAYRAIRQVAAQHPAWPVRFLIGHAQVARNPKVNNLVPALEAARHEALLIKDSNIAFEPGDLARLMRYFGPGVGLVCSIPVATGPRGFAADLEQAMMNGRDAPYVLAASVLGMDLGYGKVMLFPRGDFLRAGGVSVIADHFGDDHALSLALSRLGLRTVYTDGHVAQPLGPRPWRAVLDRQFRWLVIRRDQAFAAFASEPLVTWPVAVLSAFLAAPLLGWSGWALALATLAVRLGAEMLVQLGRGWPMGWRYPLAALARDLLTWALWLPALRARQVRWVGQAYGQGKASPPSGAR